MTDSYVPAVDAARATACLLAGALGDALGYPVEFDKGRDILERNGAKAPAELPVGDEGFALFSDDTQMTLFTVEALLDAGPHGDPIARSLDAYLRWLSTQMRGARPEGTSGALALVDKPRLQVRRAPGNTCLDALASTKPATPFSVENPANQSKGCGAIMRTAPYAFVAVDRATAYALARDAGALTHGHPAGYLPAAAFTAILWGLVRHEEMSDSIISARRLLLDSPLHEETLAALDAGMMLGARVPTSNELGTFGERTDADGHHTRGGGWTGDAALGIAVAVAVSTDLAQPDAFAEATWRAAAHDGDSDSTASLAAQLLGAQLVPEQLPQAWLADLELRDLIERAAVQLVTA